MSEPTPELRELRAEIAEIDTAVLEALNRRLELVMRVREHKQAAGTRFVDAEREAELCASWRRATAVRSPTAPCARSSPPCST